MDPNPCPHCTHEIPLDWTHCPHCGDGLRCPNVILARQAAERTALTSRYQAAVNDAARRGSEAVVQKFETLASRSQAVMGTTLQKLMPIVTGHQNVFATYYELAELRFLQESSPSGPNWNVVRPAVELALLGTHKHIDKLHYAALSLDERSLPHYGDLTILLREREISRRASIFQENSAVYFYRHGLPLPAGSRSTWENRGLLCVAKLASKITNLTNLNDFPKMLLLAGPTGVDDQFVEVNVFGSLTFKAFKKVRIRRSSPKASSSKRPRKLRGTADERALQDYCKLNGTKCEYI